MESSFCLPLNFQFWKYDANSVGEREEENGGKDQEK